MIDFDYWLGRKYDAIGKTADAHLLAAQGSNALDMARAQAVPITSSLALQEAPSRFALLSAQANQASAGARETNAQAAGLEEDLNPQNPTQAWISGRMAGLRDPGGQALARFLGLDPGNFYHPAAGYGAGGATAGGAGMAVGRGLGGGPMFQFNGGLPGLPDRKPPATTPAPTPGKLPAGGVAAPPPSAGAIPGTLRSLGGDPSEPQRPFPGYAKGTARVPGKGSPKVDSQPAMLAPGEAVLNAPAAQSLGRGLIAALNHHGAQRLGLA